MCRCIEVVFLLQKKNKYSKKGIGNAEHVFYNSISNTKKRPLLKRCANTIGQVYYITKSRNAHWYYHTSFKWYQAFLLKIPIVIITIWKSRFINYDEALFSLPFYRSRGRSIPVEDQIIPKKIESIRNLCWIKGIKARWESDSMKELLDTCEITKTFASDIIDSLCEENRKD